MSGAPMFTPDQKPDQKAQEPAKISAIGRVFGVLFNPKETFADIVRKPGWMIAMLALILFGSAFHNTLAEKIDWQSAVQIRMQKIPLAARQLDQLPADQRAANLQQAAAREKFSRRFRAIYGNLFMVFFFALVYWGAYSLIAGPGLRFMTSVSIVAHAAMPMALRELIGIPIVLAKGGLDIDPDNVVASNLAAFLPSDAPFWQYVAGASLDAFGFWMYALLVIGLAQVNPKKAGIAKTFWVVFAVWALFFALGVGFASFFS